MKAIAIRPGEKLQVIEIENSLKALQDFVGGYIQAVPVGDQVVICNEEGRLQGLDVCATVDGIDFVGSILIVGNGEEDFTDVDLDKWEIEEVAL